MHYLVTGGCGFIGAHLVERLLADGHTVTVIDDLSTGKRENLPAKARLIMADVAAPGVFESVLPQVDGCFHLAAIVSVPRSTEEWLRTHQVNMGGTVALLDAVARGKRKIPVVFASSAAVYGDNPQVPLLETAVCAPLSAYGVDKLACEWHMRIGTSIHGIPTAVLRFFNVYGPRQDPSSVYSGVITIFASRMKQHLPVTIHGDGEQSRDFVYVGDVVNGLAVTMRNLERAPLLHGIFNLCTGTPTSVNQLAAQIARVTGSRSVIDHAPARAGDIRVSIGSPALGRQLLGLPEGVTLESGLPHALHIL